MKLDPPMLTRGPLTNKMYVVTHGKVEPHPTRPGQTMVTASVKYDVSDQFVALAEDWAEQRERVLREALENPSRELLHRMWEDGHELRKPDGKKVLTWEERAAAILRKAAAALAVSPEQPEGEA